MSISALPLDDRRAVGWNRLADFVELSKPRISVLVLVTVAVSGFAARWGQPELVPLLFGLMGTTLVAASASAMNHWLERGRDALMVRTAERPLPAGRLGSGQVLGFAAVTLAAGMLVLASQSGWGPALWGFVTWFVYVCVYTPLKTTTSANTAVGAVAGAAPVLIGWTAAGGSIDPAVDPRAAAVFLTLFLWQFPHFMAIAWIYRGQYAGAGYRMLTVVDPSGRRAGVQAVLGAVALLPVSLVPALHSGVGAGAGLYLALAFAAGVAQLAMAWRFLLRRDDRTARQLLRTTLVYLPVLLIGLLLIPLV